VLKNRATNKVLFVVLFTLLLNEDVDEDGNIKPGVVIGVPFDQITTEIAEKHDLKNNATVDGTDSENCYNADDDVD
jgi:hypothetical protein